MDQIDFEVTDEISRSLSRPDVEAQDIVERNSRMGDSTPKGSSTQVGKSGVGGTGTPPPYPTVMTSSSSNNSIASTGSQPPTYQDAAGSIYSTEDQDMFRIGVRLELPHKDMIQEFAKFSMGEINCFAVALKKSEDLVLLSDHHWSSGLNEAGHQTWCMKRVPWFDDPLKRITALSFDDEGTLYIGTLDGNVIELKALRVLSDQRDSDLNTLYRLLHKIVQILIWNQDNSKILLCVGSHGNLAIISGSSTPVNVSFTTSILGVELFQNKMGLTCALVCLETGQNVYTILDDLDLPSQQNESQAKKSIFRKAKDNLMSRLSSDDKLSFFGSKRSKHDVHTASTNSVSSPNVTITTTSPTSTSQAHGTTDPTPKVTSVSGPASSASVKFQSLEECQCRGILKKVKGRSQFLRHAVNKLDIFDDDFRQVSSVFVPPTITDVYVINRLYYCVDSGAQCLRICLVHNGSLKDVAVIRFQPRILSIETIGESDASYSVFIIAEDGIYEMTLKKDPVYTCVSMLLKETSASLLEAVCNALNVSKTQVCAIAGDIKADEGKFSKSILYYKLAGLTYAQISAKFGSKGLMPAMLFFFELVDQEKTKLYGGFHDKQVMSDLALLGRIEQYLRYGSVRSELPRNPKFLVEKMVSSNIWFSSRRASEWLSQPDLLWGLKLLARTRLCYPDILVGLQQLDETKLLECLRKRLIWNLITQDWVALYSASSPTFIWFRDIVKSYVRLVDTKILYAILHVLLPWRRELQRKIFTEISDSAEIINYAQSVDVPRIVLDDYVELFVIVMLEIIRRQATVPLLPSFVFKSDARAIQRMEISNHKTNMVATLMLSFTFQKTLSASVSHVLCVRNGMVYSWGENKYGKLGLLDEKEKFNYQVPTPVNLSPSLKILVESVCAGTNHSVALTTVGTIFVWGQNNYGQLGIGPDTLWVGRPVPINVPDVIFTCVAAGSYHTVAVDHLNRAWTFGWGIHGQLGNGNVENCYYPQPLDIKEKIVAVSAGHSHTAFLTCFGRVLTAGCNHFGQLGLGIPDQKVKVPTMVNSLPAGTLIRLVECGISSTVS
ncbi:unnamed protein product [Orchesella dallaii]|uniref:RCC1-like domain-containing protein n=1 Tax=Orchesella dallaii TaxID=48710 RepID=A0ABP1Q6Z6_9HEXA